MEDQVTYNNLTDSGEPTQDVDLRAELITLAEKGEIKHSTA